METFIFATYLLALFSIVISVYAIVEVRDLKAQRKRDMITRRLQQVKPPSKSASSLWR